MRNKTDRKDSELTVFTAAKDLNAYVSHVVAVGPKAFRYSHMNHMMEYSLGLLEKLFLANSIRIEPGCMSEFERRHELQRQAYIDLKMLLFLSSIARDNNIILARQHEQIVLKGGEVAIRIHNWSESDKKRMER